MRRHWFPKPYADFVARLRVPAGFLLIVAYVWLSRPTAGTLAAGLPLAVAGLLLRGWAAGHLSKNEELAESGPYSWVRNPLYLGSLVVGAGVAIASRSVPLAVLFAATFFLVYLPVIELEEQHLRALFPAYAEYACRVPLLIPRVPASPAPARRFRWDLYLRNQEYQALAGFIAAVLVLIWKAWA
jgi:protein-S-isoprenylcysteine O-methyltransferase Ste14